MSGVIEEAERAIRAAGKMKLAPECAFLLHMRVRRTEIALESHRRSEARLARQVRMLRSRMRRYGG